MPKELPGPINSTAGAVAVRNEKGQIAMQKVKVHRYVSGKRPDYAPHSSSEEESEDEEFISPQQSSSGKPLGIKGERRGEEASSDSDDEDRDRYSYDTHRGELEYTQTEKLDPRLRRLMQTTSVSPSSSSRRRVHAPEVLEDEESDEEEEEEPDVRPGRRRDSDSDSGRDEVDEDVMERRRAFLRQRALAKREEEELLAKEEEKEGSESEAEEEEEEEESEEYTDSEEDTGPRLKPVFVRKTDRVTLTEQYEQEEAAKAEEEAKKKAAERRSETLKLVEKLISDEKKGTTEGKEKDANIPQITDVITDDENEEEEYEAWKLRELKRIKRDREEREALEREKEEIERLRNMTEEERRQELKNRPKVITNKAQKGKYKFLQKYYHRGAFYLDKEDNVLARDYSAPTLEDHFDKTILPKVMQVKNFGLSGRTKYTHLVDQDTTNFDSPWQADTTQNIKFYSTQAAGVRGVFERPSAKKRKTE